MILFCISCLFRGVPSWVDSGRIGVSILSPEGENGNHAAAKKNSCSLLYHSGSDSARSARVI